MRHLINIGFKRFQEVSRRGFRRVFKNSLFILMLIAFTACQVTPEDVRHVAQQPDIFPDYIGVTIPAEIAPMNFEMQDEDIELMDITVKGSKGGEMHFQGEYADFDAEEWHALTKANKGGQLNFTVCVLKDGKWIQYEDFEINVSDYPLDDFGLTYRLIAPGYEVGGDMGIYQRDLHSFDEYALIESLNTPGQCMNCHTANQCRADQFLFHLRGEKSGTMLQNGDNLTWLNTMTDSTMANCSYSYWHPSGHYVASSINKIYQLFYTGNKRRIEVFDTMSDVLVIDTRTNELILNPLLQQNEWLETYPAFSPDGRTLYFCSAKAQNLPDDIYNIRYSLCQIAFDAEKGCYGTQVDTLLNAERDSLSYTFPRPSYDGKWLMYDVCAFGNFPTNHPESDIWLMNLKTGQTHPLKEANSDDADSYHSWSSNSHWIVFSSRRDGGVYNKAYIASIDNEGRATKPFLLPQRHPKQYYDELLESYNCPDFTHEKVELDVRKASDKIMHGKDKQQVTIR